MIAVGANAADYNHFYSLDIDVIGLSGEEFLSASLLIRLLHRSRTRSWK